MNEWAYGVAMNCVWNVQCARNCKWEGKMAETKWLSLEKFHLHNAVHVAYNNGLFSVVYVVCLSSANKCIYACDHYCFKSTTIMVALLFHLTVCMKSSFICRCNMYFLQFEPNDFCCITLIVHIHKYVYPFDTCHQEVFRALFPWQTCTSDLLNFFPTNKYDKGPKFFKSTIHGSTSLFQ